MNETDIERLAAAINHHRPDWPIPSLRTFITRELATRAYRDVAVALTWVAVDRKPDGSYASDTPRRVLEAGPWWVATGAAAGVDRRWSPPKAEQACGRHPGEHRDRCRICPVGDIPAHHDDAEDVAPVSGVLAEHMRSLRAVKAAATAEHCAHGVPRDHCADHRPLGNRPTEEETA